MTAFALIGAGGYVAPRHMKAIKAVGGDLKVAFDPNDFRRRDRQLFPGRELFRRVRALRPPHRQAAPARREDRLRVDLLAELSARCALPLRAALGRGCDLREAAGAQSLEYRRPRRDRAATPAGKISTILQLRLHPAIQALKKKIEASGKNEFAVDLTYITSRGRWYHTSWKGDEAKSGGVATNIGVHFFDMLSYRVRSGRSATSCICASRERAAGYLECGRARIRWFLSVDRNDLPASAQRQDNVPLDHRRRRGGRVLRRLHRPAHPQLRGNPGRARLRPR